MVELIRAMRYCYLKGMGAKVHPEGEPYRAWYANGYNALFKHIEDYNNL